MKIRLIKKQTIEDYIENNAPSKVSFEIWLAILKHADWDMPGNIIATFGTADILGQRTDRAVFNIAGNKYRMICKYHFGVSKVHLFIKWIGTHAEYSKLCKNNEQYDIDTF